LPGLQVVPHDHDDLGLEAHDVERAGGVAARSCTFVT
jgi:hypothetical protein